MKKALLISGIVLTFIVCLAINANSSETYTNAKASFDAGDYDEAIRLLTDATMDDPTSWKINTLLCKAQVEKAAILKTQGDKSYMKLLKKPYRKAKMLRKMNKFHPDPYYIAARVLMIKGTYDGALRWMKKASKLSPNNPVYSNYVEEIKKLITDDTSGEELTD